MTEGGSTKCRGKFSQQVKACEVLKLRLRLTDRDLHRDAPEIVAGVGSPEVKSPKFELHWLADATEPLYHTQ